MKHSPSAGWRIRQVSRPSTAGKASGQSGDSMCSAAAAAPASSRSGLSPSRRLVAEPRVETSVARAPCAMLQSCNMAGSGYLGQAHQALEHADGGSAGQKCWMAGGIAGKAGWLAGWMMGLPGCAAGVGLPLQLIVPHQYVLTRPPHQRANHSSSSGSGLAAKCQYGCLPD